MAQIQAAFGRRSLDTVFSTLSPRAVAAASLGQVYRGTLVDGREVAIKVRRPGVLDSVSLDLHLMRGLALQMRGMSGVRGKGMVGGGGGVGRDAEARMDELGTFTLSAASV